MGKLKFYAQFLEDKYLFETFNLPRHGYFVDIGAGNGHYGSTTKFFENLGWSGLCIEPNTIDYLKCLKIRKNVLNAAVSSTEGKQKFYYCEKIPSLSGLKIHDENYKEIMVNCLRLDSIMKRYKIKHIDLLSIDTEGTEVDVLNSFDIRKVKPRIIIVEHITRKIENVELKEYFDQLSDLYKLKKTLGANWIFVLKKIHK